MSMPTSPSPHFHCVFASPVGSLTLIAHEQALLALHWQAHRHPIRIPAGEQAPDHPLLCRAREQLTAYFNGTRQGFELPLELRGTDFQRQVWQALLEIPYGQTRSYAQLAAAIGQPSAVRAVGAANGRNPLSILVPCHRVIGSQGQLTGFGGGLEAKRRLLALEHPQQTLFDPLL